MVKKYVCVLDHDTGQHRPYDDQKEREFILGINKDVQLLLTQYKDSIDTFFKDGSWDKYKKRTNAYECIFTSTSDTSSHGISEYRPVSRSFFKMWEILKDFEDSFKPLDPTKKCAFLAEGPGGFVEAYAMWRDSHGKLKDDNIFATTLYNNLKRSVPSFRIPEWIQKGCEDFTITYGPDHTGNICNIHNIKGLVQEIGQDTCDLVTADGGFDFSSNFNMQEQMSSTLIMCEILLALQIQKKGGSFVLKLYDISMYQTFQIIYLLQRNYKHVNMVKPLTSRPANSEKYLVCTDFLGNAQDDIAILSSTVSSRRSSPLPLQVPIPTMYSILEFNIYFMLKQMMYIHKTINCVVDDVKSNDIFTQSQIRKAIKWCSKYKIPTNQIVIESLSSTSKT